MLLDKLLILSVEVIATSDLGIGLPSPKISFIISNVKSIAFITPIKAYLATHDAVNFSLSTGNPDFNFFIVSLYIPLQRP